MYTRRLSIFLVAAQCIVPDSFAEYPTYSKDIAPVLERSCQVCHHPGSIGPMSLTTYREVRPWAKSIRRRVLDREMPDAPKGFYLHDTRLSERKIGMISEWVENQCPQGIES